MGFWTVIMVIAIVAIVMTFVTRIVKMSLRHEENIQRIKRGYPTLDGERPFAEEHAEPEAQESGHSDRLQ